MGLVGLTRPILWNSSRHVMPSASTLSAFNEKLKTSPFLNWYTSDWDYALTTVYFFCAAIGVFTLVNLVTLLKPKSRQGPRPSARIMGFSRYISSKQYHIPMFGWYSPPLGPMLMVAVILTFILALSFAVQPYYWPAPGMGNSPPLGTRTGWICMGILPFMLAFSTKFNLITYLTGTSHEKLQVLHRWTAWIMYITTLLHTFPFVVYNIRIGTMVLNYNTKTFYWTGVAALVPQTWLVLMSWGPIRSRYYETFKKLHFIAAIIFMVFLFLHCNFRLSSWDYIAATVGIYFFSWFARVGLTVFRNGFSHRATFENLPGHLVKVTIPTTMKWSPGQHYFVRFFDMGIHAFSSHPFTASTLSSSGRLELYIRPQRGMSGRLDTFAKQSKSSGVLLDGPYGGVHGSLRDYDRVLLLAGGSGASFTVPLLLDLIQGFSMKNNCRHVHFVWAVPNYESSTWFEDLFKEALKAAPEGSVTLSIYVSDSSRSSSPSSSDMKEGGKSTVEISSGRPNIAQIIRDNCSTPETVGIAACGPDSFAYDVRNTVAACELEIVAGSSTCKNIYLHTEDYSW